MSIFKVFFGIVIVGVLSGCSMVAQDIPSSAFSSEAQIATQTKTADLLKRLPRPTTPITVAVYEFADYTGQNKPSEVQSFSRAVTQGGVSIIKKALLDAAEHRFFRVLERGGLNNLLQERKIVRSMRSSYAGPNGEQLPDLGPMLYAGLIIEGGIISYESNVVTGGLGARYLGIGGSTEYSRDMVTVYLRVVSVKSGEVLASVNSSKTIFSRKLQGGVFKFVSYDKLIESEAGVSFNEPPQLAVRQATEFAVYMLALEGYRQGLWKFADESAGRQALNEYLVNYLGEVPSQQQNVRSEQQSALQSGNSVGAPEQSQRVANQKEELDSLDAPSAITSDKKTSKQEEPSTVASTSIGVDRDFDVKLEKGWYLKVKESDRVGELERSIVKKLNQAGFNTVVKKVTSEAITPSYFVLVGPYQNKNSLMHISNGYGFQIFYESGAGFER